MALLIFTASMPFTAYAGNYELPRISLPSGGKNSSLDDADGQWETPPVPLSGYINVSKCTVSSISAKVYSGSAFKPSPTVKYGKTALKKGTDYKLTYKNNKAVGTATVTITGIGSYTGTKKVTFKINPKGTSLKKVTSPKKKQLKVTWKKQTTQTKGYQLQYSTSRKFTAKKTKSVWVTSNKTTAKTVKKLTSNKKYYVRIRTYKTVDGKKYYSAWSKTLSVKVK